MFGGGLGRQPASGSETGHADFAGDRCVFRELGVPFALEQLEFQGVVFGWLGIQVRQGDLPAAS
jgi:hypothetical protein